MTNAWCLRNVLLVICCQHLCGWQDDSNVVFTLATSLNVSSSVTKHTKLSILGTVFFFYKNPVQYIIYSHGIKIQHQYISAGNTKWVCTKCMLCKCLQCALFVFSPVQRVRMHGALFLRPCRLWHGATLPFIFSLHNNKQIMEGLFLYSVVRYELFSHVKDQLPFMYLKVPRWTDPSPATLLFHCPLLNCCISLLISLLPQASLFHPLDQLCCHIKKICGPL